ncbi:MAG: helicase-exonuclease AddAB subunit AddB, partial [Clostridiales bacterium]
MVEPPLLLRETAGRFRRGGELSMLERNLAAPGSISPSMVKPTAIRLFHATTRREELLGVGREIIRLTRDQGLRYRDIGVIIRATAPYEQLLPQIFGDLQIPYFLDSKKSLLYHPLIELVRATLENWAYQLRQENIFRYLKNPLSPLTLEQGDRLENYCLANGIKLWSWEKAEPWMGTRGLNPETAAAELQEIDQLRRLAAGALLEFCHSLGKKAQAAQIGRALRTLLERLAAEQKIAAWAKRAKLQGQGAEGELQQQVWACLQQFLAEAELLLQQTVLSPEEAIGVFDAAFQGLTISMIPPGLDEVFVSSLERSVNPPLQVAFVLNVNDTVLPQRIAAEGLFTEKERQQLAEAQITLAPNQRLRQLAENFLSYTALTRSGGLLYLSYVLRDEQGAACLPSPLVGQIKELFTALEEENYDQIALPELLTGMGADV